MLSGISHIKHVIQAVCVKLVDPYQEPQVAALSTFRVYPGTRFPDVKRAACAFWQKLEQRYTIADERLNCLEAYQDSVLSFFELAQPLNANGEAVVYLMQTSPRLQGLHPLQRECTVVQQSKPEKEEEHSLEAMRKETLDVDKVARQLKGLHLYGEPEQVKVEKYLR